MMRERNAMEVCIFGVLAASTARTVFHLAPLPASLAASGWMGQAAATVLFIGCLISIAGVAWRDRFDGLVIEQFGLALAGFGLVFYSVALAQRSPFSSSAIAFGLSFGIAFACGYRYFQIQRFVKTYKIAQRALSRIEES